MTFKINIDVDLSVTEMIIFMIFSYYFLAVIQRSTSNDRPAAKRKKLKSVSSEGSEKPDQDDVEVISNVDIARNTRIGVVLKVYAYYLVITAIYGVYRVAQAWHLEQAAFHELSYAMVVNVLIMIHASYHFHGRHSYSFALVSTLGRMLALYLFFAVESLSNTFVIHGEPLVNVPHFSALFGIVEGVFLLFQLRALKEDKRKFQWPSKFTAAGVNRMVFGVVLICVGFFLLFETNPALELLDSPHTQQQVLVTQCDSFMDLPSLLFAVPNPIVYWLSAYTQVNMNAGIAPLQFTSCFIRLLGLYNIVGGAYNNDELIRSAGQRGGFMFTILSVLLVVFGVFSYKMLVFAAIDMVSIVLLKVLAHEKSD